MIAAMAAVFSVVFAAAVAAVLWIEQPASRARRRTRRLYAPVGDILHKGGVNIPGSVPSTPGAAMRLSAVPHDAHSSPRLSGRSGSIGAAWRSVPSDSPATHIDVCVWHDGSLRALATVHNVVSRLRHDAPSLSLSSRRPGDAAPGDAVHVVLVGPGRPSALPALPHNAWFVLLGEAGADSGTIEAVRRVLSGTEAAEAVVLLADAEEEALVGLSRKVRSLVAPSLPWATIEPTPPTKS